MRMTWAACGKSMPSALVTQSERRTVRPWPRSVAAWSETEPQSALTLS